MDRVPVLFVEEICRQLTTNHSSALEKLPFWRNVAKNLFRNARNVTCFIFCNSETGDVRADLRENSKRITLQALKSSPNVQLERVEVFINNNNLVGEPFTSSYAAQLLKLCSKLYFPTTVYEVAFEEENVTLEHNFPVLEHFLLSLPRIHYMIIDNWVLMEAIAGRAADKGTLRELKLNFHCDLGPNPYKAVLRKMCKCESLKLFRYSQVIKPNIEMSDEEKEHFRMVEKPDEHAVDFFRICD
uniref:FBD domain-containing protein n=1 Tax=Steinernema glaseri TaxID=37863 RepID=A0A1I7ZB69_9BILA